MNTRSFHESRRLGAPDRLLRTAWLLPAWLVFSASPALAEDWPTHRHDLARSGVTAEKLKPPLVSAWTYTSRHRPQPAWHGPARRDGWHKTENLKPRVIFDWAFHVIAVGGRVYFGSSADDKVVCLDDKTGKEVWTAFTDGPIRLAPTVANGRVYVGSDDGNVYCLNAETGKRLWRCKASPVDYRVAGNERIMSVWPVRSGVAVDGNIAYFCSGLFAFEGAYVCAADATSGKLLWSRKTTVSCPQGYILVSPERLYLPMGGGPPGVFSRKDGRLLYLLGSSGGAFAVLAGDDLLSGPGKTGTMEAYKGGRTDQVASFAGNTIVVKGTMSYLHTDTELSALDRGRYLNLSDERNTLRRRIDALKKRLKDHAEKQKKAGTQPAEGQADPTKEITAKIRKLESEIADIERELPKCVGWKRPCKYPYSLILAGEVLYAGGTNEVAAFDAKDGKTLWTHKVSGRALDLAVAGGLLVVSTDEGVIHGFKAK